MKEEPEVKLRRMRPEQDADIPLPRYMTTGAAGMDLHAAIEGQRILDPGRTALLPTGFAIELPDGFEGQIRPRSGLAVKHGIGLINSPGTIDADYRGEVMVAVINWSDRPYTFSRGDRIAQLVIQRMQRVRLELVETLNESERGGGGFGHTDARPLADPSRSET